MTDRQLAADKLSEWLAEYDACLSTPERMWANNLIEALADPNTVPEGSVGGEPTT